MDGDAEPSTASGGCSEAEHPQRSKKSSSEQREDIFGYRKAEGANTPWLPLERICAQYGFVFPDY